METKRIRLAVVITSEGEWMVEGWSDGNDTEKRNVLDENFCPDNEGATKQVYFVEAEVPVPLPGGNTIEGQVALEE